MKSTLRILSAVKSRRLPAVTQRKLPLPFPVRTLHASVPRSMPVRGSDGRRLWSDEELRNAERRGFENAGGKWTGSSTPHSTGEYTAEDLKAALNKGMEQADQYVGAAIRGVWDKGFGEGKIVGATEERVVSEQKIQAERVSHEYKVRARIADERKSSYAEGLAANPDFVKAKQKGHVEGEKVGREQAEKIAERNNALYER